MMLRRALALALMVMVQVNTPPADLNPALEAILTRELMFSAEDIAGLVRGTVVGHTVTSETPGEITAVGAARIGASADSFLEQFRDIVHFKESEGVVQIGRFRDPPTMDDLAGLTVGPEDFDARHCRVGNCSIRLPAATIARVQHEINWKAPDANVRAVSFFKQVLLDEVRAYWSGGPGRILEYDDDKRPIRPVAEFAGILANSPYLNKILPGLPGHLRDFPAGRLTGADDFLYWSKERFGIAPFITVTHVTIAPAASGLLVITSKDVYSSRYFDSSLGLTMVAPARNGGFFLVYANRSRASALKGGFSALRRSMVERRARGSLEQSLKAIKSRLERRR